MVKYSRGLLFVGLSLQRVESRSRSTNVSFVFSREGGWGKQVWAVFTTRCCLWTANLYIEIIMDVFIIRILCREIFT